jgi:hypothetical protein
MSFALILVDPKGPLHSVGRLYQLQGFIGHEMELLILDQYDLSDNKSYISSTKLFSMPQSFLERFGLLVNQTKCPPRPSPLTPNNLASAECGEDTRRWVADILHGARTQLYEAGLLLDVLDDCSWIGGRVGRWSSRESHDRNSE